MKPVPGFDVPGPPVNLELGDAKPCNSEDPGHSIPFVFGPDTTAVPLCALIAARGHKILGAIVAAYGISLLGE